MTLCLTQDRELYTPYILEDNQEKHKEWHEERTCVDLSKGLTQNKDNQRLVDDHMRWF